MVPHWWKEAKPPKTSFKRAPGGGRREADVARRLRARALPHPAEGWYEWQAVERVDRSSGEVHKAKQPYFVRAKESELFCFAGLAAY